MNTFPQHCATWLHARISPISFFTNYELIITDICANRRMSFAGVLQNSKFYSSNEEGPELLLPGIVGEMSFVFSGSVSNEAEFLITYHRLIDHVIENIL